MDWMWWSKQIWGLLDSNFTAALAGAFAGAWAAQRIAAKAKLDEDVRTEIVRTKAAIELVYSFQSRDFDEEGVRS
jgi:hypothetical protein